MLRQCEGPGSVDWLEGGRGERTRNSPICLEDPRVVLCYGDTLEGRTLQGRSRGTRPTIFWPEGRLPAGEFRVSKAY